jgi:hypothetical protein
MTPLPAIALAAKSIGSAAGQGRLVELWSRLQLPVTLGFGAIALGVLGFLCLRSSIGGQSPSAATSALLVGFLGTVAFVLLSVSAIVLNGLLVELTRDLRQLKKELD